MTNTRLTIVGSGIKLLSHLTTEVRAHIEKSDKVLYLVNEPLMQEWIAKNSKWSESLDGLYQKYPTRLQCYQAITDYIIEVLQTQCILCVVTYGHPTVFAQPLLAAVNKARELGLEAQTLPGISAEDCLFADVGVNPGDVGCQSFECTDFMLYHRVFDPRSHLLLWQVGVIGLLSQPHEDFDNSKGAALLLEVLSEHYPQDHPIVMYEAAQYPHFIPRIDRHTLKELVEVKYTPITTLYIPPFGKAQRDDEILRRLGIKVS